MAERSLKVSAKGIGNYEKRSGGGDFLPGKVQPRAPELEKAVLGALMLDKDAISVVLDILKVDSFYLDSHQLVYKAMLKLFEKSQPIDMLTVVEMLRKNGDLAKAGGPFFITELTNKVASAANIEFHARIISQKHILREMIKVSDSVLRDAYDETTDVFQLLDSTEQNLYNITQQHLKGNVENMGSLSSQLLKQLEELKNRPEGLTGVPTGFTDLDRLTNGWQNSDLIIVAARPGMGKTSFVLSLARNAASQFGKGVAMFSLEMSSLQLAQRIVSLEAEISGSKLRDGKLEDYEWQQLNTSIEAMSDLPIHIDDTPAINIFELRAKCRRLKKQHGIDLVIIDYLQLMSGDAAQRGNREQEISKISRSLKALAKELNVPVIALSQLSRAVETRGGSKRPQLSDLRESGAIEQDADIVSFIYRPEYYQILEDEEGNSLKNKAEIIIAKHRNGALDTVMLKFTSDFAKFSDLDKTDFGDFALDIDDAVITRTSRMNDDEDIPF